MTDVVVKMAHGSQGRISKAGATNLRYWAESDMSKALGFDDTMGKDADYDDAEEHFKDDLGIDEPEVDDRLAQMGYDKKLPNDKVRLVENPKKYMEEYIESILKGKSKDNDVLEKEKEEVEPKEIHPIIKRQLNSLKNSMNSHGLTADDVINYIKKDNE